MVIDDVHDHFFGTDQAGKPIVAVNAACQAYTHYVLSPAWVPKPVQRAAPRLCDVFGLEPLQLPATGLSWSWTWPEACKICKTTDSTTSTLLGWARTLDRWGGGDWLRYAAWL